MGYNIGVRLIEDFLARTNSGRCVDFRDTSEKIQVISSITSDIKHQLSNQIISRFHTNWLQQAFRTYLSVFPQITNWSTANDEFSLIFETNPLTEFVELPDHCLNLKYNNILPGVLRGACEMVRN